MPLKQKPRTTSRHAISVETQNLTQIGAVKWIKVEDKPKARKTVLEWITVGPATLLTRTKTTEPTRNQEVSTYAYAEQNKELHREKLFRRKISKQITSQVPATCRPEIGPKETTKIMQLRQPRLQPKLYIGSATTSLQNKNGQTKEHHSNNTCTSPWGFPAATSGDIHGHSQAGQVACWYKKLNHSKYSQTWAHTDNWWSSANLASRENSSQKSGTATEQILETESVNVIVPFLNNPQSCQTETPEIFGMDVLETVLSTHNSSPEFEEWLSRDQNTNDPYLPLSSMILSKTKKGGSLWFLERASQ